MFEVSVDHTFAAGHALRNYKGKCENVHGHNYKVRVTIAGNQLDSTGLLVDFADLRAAIKAVVDRLDHRFLNDAGSNGPVGRRKSGSCRHPVWSVGSPRPRRNVCICSV
jgi:queuosine biosynthesis protein QueD